jgi:hypothetical protein
MFYGAWNVCMYVFLHEGGTLLMYINLIWALKDPSQCKHKWLKNVMSIVIAII